MKTTNARLLAALALTLGTIAPSQVAHAQVFLVGAELYSATSTGANSGTDYSYSTNSNTFHARLSLTLGASTQNNAISFGLSPGANNFTFTVGPSFNPGSFAGVNLLFNSTGTSFNPATATGVPGNLTVVGSTTTPGSFFVPLSGILVRTYDAGTGTTPATGATSFAVGGQTVTVTAMTVNNVPSGSFTLRVSGASAPEPGTLALLALGGTLVIVARRRRLQ